MLDGLLSEIRILGLFTGYTLHPAYRVSRVGGPAGRRSWVR
ncbi:MAG TPA: hypothetical protein VN646_17855 [Candidatus Acidoferrum sp.]|nr:hypothetical protein [Candidatus Acidoferrum sp.]